MTLCNAGVCAIQVFISFRRAKDGSFMAIATMSTQGQNTSVFQKYMKVDVRIIVSNKTLWQQVFG